MMEKTATGGSRGGHGQLRLLRELGGGCERVRARARASAGFRAAERAAGPPYLHL